MAVERRRHGGRGDRQRSSPSSRSSGQESSPAIVSRSKSGIFAAVLVGFVFLSLCFYHIRDPASGDGVDFSYSDILRVESRVFGSGDKRKLNGSNVLGYVTPWNSKGYDMAKKYREKFTHVSPVWYQLKRDEQGMRLTGKHDVDQGWILDVRKQGSPLIVPRVVLEGWSLEAMLVNAAEKKNAFKLLLDECKEQGYDGIVLEAWNSWSGYGILGNKGLREKDLGSALHNLKTPSGNRSLQLLLVVPPLRGGGVEEFKLGDVELLQHAVDGFSLMTYDFSNAYRPGPNAPIMWIKACLRSLLPENSKAILPKVLMGINFYGNDYVLPQGGGAIVADQFVELLKLYTPKFVWDSTEKEHYFDYIKDQNKHRVYFPTAKSISLRLEESIFSGVGISIWEIGQGLEHFFDLL